MPCKIVLIMAAISLHNWNYDATRLLSKVDALINRDRKLFGSVVQRSATQTLATGETEHVITFIEILPLGVHVGNEDRNYGNIRFFQETYALAELNTRLQDLQERRFRVGPHTFTFEAQFGFSDQYEPSNNEYGTLPGTVFNVAARYSILPNGPLWHHELPSHDSAYDAIREYIKLPRFNDFSDSRLGHILVYVPNFNAQLERLALTGNDLAISIAGASKYEDLIFEVLYSDGKRKQRQKRRFSGKAEHVSLDFKPLELHVLLFSQSGELVDFHDETLMFSRGCNAVLPKQVPVPVSIVETDGEIEIVGVADNGSSGAQIEKEPSVKSLPGKEQFLDDAERSLAQTLELAILVVDLDNFKLVNDTKGHLAGDACLEAVVSILAAIVFRKGKLYRWGGDEFTVLLDNFDITEAQATAERIRVAVERGAVGGDVKVTTSIGVAATGNTQATSAKELLHAADIAMYASKNSGKNRVTTTESTHATGAAAAR